MTPIDGYAIRTDRYLEPSKPRYERAKGPGWTNVSAGARNEGRRHQYDKERRKIYVLYPTRTIVCAPSFYPELWAELKKVATVDKAP